MKPSVLLLGLLALAGCPSDPEPAPYPPRLWITLDGSELRIKLTPIEPHPF